VALIPWLRSSKKKGGTFGDGYILYYVKDVESHIFSLAFLYITSEFFLIPFYLQAVQIHSANGVKLLEA
jgi:hypothetical protein